MEETIETRNVVGEDKPAVIRVRGDNEPLKQALDSLYAELDLHPVITDWATAKELFRFDERPGDFFELKQAPAAGAKEIVIVCQPTERFLKLVAAIQACNVKQGIGVE